MFDKHKNSSKRFSTCFIHGTFCVAVVKTRFMNEQHNNQDVRRDNLRQKDEDGKGSTPTGSNSGGM